MTVLASSVHLTAYAQVAAALAEPRLAVVSPPPEPGPMGRLRAAVARFTDGPAHLRRRGLAEAMLTGLDPAGLRSAAHAAVRAGISPDQVGYVPVRVLAARLGVPERDLDAAVAAVRTVAAAYPPGSPAVPGADAAVTTLARLLPPGGPTTPARLLPSSGPTEAGAAGARRPARLAGTGAGLDEQTAARIGLLVQACEATAGLIANTLRAVPDTPEWPVADVLAEVLRHDPPVRATRRVCAADTAVGSVLLTAGTPVLLDLAAANRDPAVFDDPDRFDPARPDRDRHLTLGAGPHRCPGRDPATALAAGVVTAVWEVAR